MHLEQSCPQSRRKPLLANVFLPCCCIQSAHLIMTVDTAFFVVIEHIDFFFPSNGVVASSCMHSGQKQYSFCFFLEQLTAIDKIIGMFKCILNCACICFGQKASSYSLWFRPPQIPIFSLNFLTNRIIFVFRFCITSIYFAV